ncbi:hypothetical protein ACI3KS_14215 [Microbacterium sp. ZW T5_45]|uniref:hypothetical protein n=1 Tax=Microbacterium sp. ZW T5_45 TaxID=3378080 RepID=UPI0038535B98
MVLWRARGPQGWAGAILAMSLILSGVAATTIATIGTANQRHEYDAAGIRTALIG